MPAIVCLDISHVMCIYTERVKGQAIMSALPVWLPTDHH